MSVPETKLCSKCKKVKHHSEFSKKKSAKDGLQGWCKECCNDSRLSLVDAKKMTSKWSVSSKLNYYKKHYGLNYELFNTTEKSRKGNMVSFNCLTCGKKVTYAKERASANNFKCNSCLEKTPTKLSYSKETDASKNDNLCNNHVHSYLSLPSSYLADSFIKNIKYLAKRSRLSEYEYDDKINIIIVPIPQSTETKNTKNKSIISWFKKLFRSSKE